MENYFEENYKKWGKISLAWQSKRYWNCAQRLLVVWFRGRKTREKE